LSMTTTHRRQTHELGAVCTCVARASKSLCKVDDFQTHPTSRGVTVTNQMRPIVLSECVFTIFTLFTSVLKQSSPIDTFKILFSTYL
jgi:hypothetical protein